MGAVGVPRAGTVVSAVAASSASNPIILRAQLPSRVMNLGDHGLAALLSGKGVADWLAGEGGDAACADCGPARSGVS
ncbi:MAG: hypothetical protein RLN77_07605, partial [Rhodospirillales bacterium]